MIRHEIFDRFAIALSSLCAIHCIALPIVASVTPLLITTVEHGHDSHEFWFHQFILYFIIPISLFALITGYRCHRKILPMLIGGLGLCILVIVALFAEPLIHYHLISHTEETVLTIIGGIIHATGHISNVLATRGSHHARCSTVQ